MSRLVLDTSAYSQFQRGEPTVASLLDRAHWVGVPTVVLGELRTGFAMGSRREANDQRLALFLSHPVVSILPVTDEAASLYAEMVVGLRRAGNPLPTNDVWIAAVAGSSGATVLTFDRHFGHIRGVAVRLLRLD